MADKCTCRDDMACQYCLDKMAEEDGRGWLLQLTQEFWAGREADFVYDPLSRGGFE